MTKYIIKFINKQGKTFNEYEITTEQKIDIVKMWKAEKSFNDNLAEIRILEDNKRIITSAAFGLFDFYDC